MPLPPIGVTIRKLNVLRPNEVFYKSQMPLIVNKKDYNLAYGQGYTDTDFMYAIVPEGKVNDIYYGRSILDMPTLLRHSNGRIWCYDFTFMDRETLEKVRKYNYCAKLKSEIPNYTSDSIVNWENIALGKFRKQMTSRDKDYMKEPIELKDHPKVIQDKVARINSSMFGFNLFDW